jgi:hypothetical protein
LEITIAESGPWVDGSVVYSRWPVGRHMEEHETPLSQIAASRLDVAEGTLALVSARTQSTPKPVYFELRFYDEDPKGLDDLVPLETVSCGSAIAVQDPRCVDLVEVSGDGETSHRLWDGELPGETRWITAFAEWEVVANSVDDRDHAAGAWLFEVVGP